MPYMSRAVFSSRPQAEKALNALREVTQSVENNPTISEAVEKSYLSTDLTSSESAFQRWLKHPTPIIHRCKPGFYLKGNEAKYRALLPSEEA